MVLLTRPELIPRWQERVARGVGLAFWAWQRGFSSRDIMLLWLAGACNICTLQLQTNCKETMQPSPTTSPTSRLVPLCRSFGQPLSCSSPIMSSSMACVGVSKKPPRCSCPRFSYCYWLSLWPRVCCLGQAKASLFYSIPTFLRSIPTSFSMR